MITLTIICLLYSIVGTIRFKKLYGHSNIFDEKPMLWTFILVLAMAMAFALGLFLILKYLP